MKSKKIAFLLSTIIFCGIISTSACSNEAETSGTDGAGTTTEATTTMPPATLSSEDKEIIESLETSGNELENKTVKWLSFWDINPANGKAVPVNLELFQKNYGGEIEYIQTTWEEKFEKLSTLVASGDSPDMFPAGDMDVVPRCVISNLFSPLDDYVDYSSPLWADMQPINDQFVFQDKHYVAAVSTDASVVCIYNKKTIEENGLDDPKALFEAGNWNWDTFYDMMIKFSSPDEGKYCIDGWWFESAFSISTGFPYIGLKDGKVIHNLDNPLIEKAQEFMQKLNQQMLPIPKSDFNWEIQPSRMGDGRTLFWPVGIWQLQNADLSDFGEMEDIMFVPMPRCPYADEYYTSVNLSAYSLVAGASNPEGVAAFLECSRIASRNEEVEEIYRKQLMEDYHWTQEMYDMLQVVEELTAQHPVVEFYGAVNPDVHELINNPMKKSYNEGASWTQVKEEIRFMVDAELEKVNAKTVS